MLINTLRKKTKTFSQIFSGFGRRSFFFAAQLFPALVPGTCKLISVIIMAYFTTEAFWEDRYATDKNSYVFGTAPNAFLVKSVSVLPDHGKLILFY